MPRLKITLPPELPFHTILPIRITDINYGGHLGNDAVLSLIHEARVRYLTSMGYAEFNIEGVGIIMADAQIVFASEGFYGNEVRAEVGIGEVDGVRCSFFYRLTNITTGKELARAVTGIAFFDYAARKPIAAPPGFLQKVRQVSSSEAPGEPTGP